MQRWGQIQQPIGEPEFEAARTERAFRIGTTDEVEMLVLPEILRALRSSAPGIRLSCHRLQGFMIPPEKELQSGSLDLAIGTFPLPHSTESGLFGLSLYDDTWVCIARRGHPELRSGAMSQTKFVSLPHASTYYMGEGPGAVDRALAQLGRARRIAVSVAHGLTLPLIIP